MLDPYMHNQSYGRLWTASELVRSAFTVLHFQPRSTAERLGTRRASIRACAPLSKKLEAELQIRFSCTKLLFAATDEMSMSWVTVTVLLVFSSCSCTPASGQTSCSLSGRKSIIMHAYLPNYGAYLSFYNTCSYSVWTLHRYCGCYKSERPNPCC